MVVEKNEMMERSVWQRGGGAAPTARGPSFSKGAGAKETGGCCWSIDEVRWSPQRWAAAAGIIELEARRWRRSLEQQRR